MPVYLLVSQAALSVESTPGARRRNVLASVVLYAVVAGCFVAGVCIHRSMHIGRLLYVMHTVFVGGAIFLIVNTAREIRLKHRRLEEQTGADMQPYVRYSQSGFLLMCASALMTVFAVLSRTILFIIAPDVSRRDLSVYFSQYLHHTFRVWLSDIRMAEAQRLILAHPEYSNDTISAECGFSSRSQLYKLFRDRYGMSPKEWRDHVAIAS